MLRIYITLGVIRGCSIDMVKMVKIEEEMKLNQNKGKHGSITPSW
jgi:hypothetical protein